MTDNNVTALRPLDSTAALADGDEFRKTLGRWQELIKGGAVPKGETPHSCLAKARYGEAYGWDALVSVNRIYLVDGRPTLSSESMLGLVREKLPDAEIVKVQSDAEVCVLKARRKPTDEWWTVSVHIDDFRHLSKKQNWQQYPRNMLYWRCSSCLCRELFSDVTLGAYTPEELQEQTTVQQVESADDMVSAALAAADADEVQDAEVTDADT